MSFSSSFSRRIQEENENPPPTGMNLGFQKLEERIITTTHTNCNNTQLRVQEPSIIDSVGCDITIEDIQLAKRELSNKGVDLKMDVNKSQLLSRDNNCYWVVTPLIHFCWTGNLLFVKLLFLIGAKCTRISKINWFPMLSAVQGGRLDICQWIF